MNNLLRNIPYITKNLLLINVVIYLIMNIVFPQYYYDLSLHYFKSPYFKPFQVVSHMFMHGGIGHLFFNMFALVIFGSILERVWEAKRYLFLYLCSGIGAAVIYQLTMYFGVSPINGVLLGASGAISGLLAAFAYLFPNTELQILFFPMPIKAKYLIPGYFLLDLFLAQANFEWDNIGHYAHLGGALIGLIIVLIWKKDRSRFY